VIGHPVGHSLSPIIHNAGFAAAAVDWVYTAFDVAPGRGAQAVEAMRSLHIGGLSVTMPHKDSVAAAVDRLSPAAGLLGAVNTVAWDGVELVGHNTDGAGFIDSLTAELGRPISGQRCVVLGAGGAARAVCLALGEAGAADVAVANRTPSKAEVAAGLAGRAGRAVPVGDTASLAEADVIVNATSVGMAGTPDARSLPLEASVLTPRQAVVDLVYHPTETPLLAASRAVGATAINGVAMLVYQAAHQFKLWTGIDAPVGAMSEAARQAIEVRENP